MRNIRCLLWKHELDVRTISIRWHNCPVFKQTVKCNKCEHTIQIDWPSKEEMYILIE